MWSEIPAFVLGLVTLAVTADLFSNRSARSLRRLHGQAQLLPLLPAGPGRDALAQHIDTQVQSLITHLKGPTTQRGRRDAALLATAAAAALVWVGGATLGALLDDRPDWVRNVSLGALVVVAACTAWMALAARRGPGGQQ